MKKIKVITIVGTRPEVIKLAPVIAEFKKHSDVFSSKVILTGQHRSMVDQFLLLFSLRPDYDLDIMRPDQTLNQVAVRCLERLDPVLKKEKPDLILVEGDTTTAFIAGFGAFNLKIPVGHVEAGLRTNDKFRPFPEEMNRCLLSVIAALHFAPTTEAAKNLISEGIEKKRVVVTGNTVVDALKFMAAKKPQPSVSELKKLDFRHKKVILVTAHRRESFGAPLMAICRALKEIAADPTVEIVYPVHLNPNVRKPVQRILGKQANIHLLSPLDYPTLVFLLMNCYLVLTDSGGIQEEAPTFGKPLLVMREVTERPEGVKAGVARLVGMDADRIVRETRTLLTSGSRYKSMARRVYPYGDGKAARRIVQAVRKTFILKK